MVVLLRTSVGQSLRAARTTQGRTLRDVARDARVSLGYLSEVERGQKEPSSELLASICSALDLPLSRVLTEVAQTPVPILGKMFSTNFCPSKSANVVSDKSVLDNVKFGAMLPTSGNVPNVFTGLPPNVIFAIISFLFSVNIEQQKCRKGSFKIMIIPH